MSKINIGIIGLGTVGGGVVNVLMRNHDEITRRAGHEINIVQAAVSSLGRERICSTDHFELTDDPFAVVDNPAIDVVLELMGGENPARELVLRAIKNGKHVVTANKALIALHGNEIFSQALKQGVSVGFEAAVAGGIPIIKAIREGLTANRIGYLAGIINGTGNFILSEMSSKGRAFDDVLSEAQALGYAEADPTFDVEGIDAAHKLCILSSIAFGISLQFESVYTEGISLLTREDIRFADELGYVIKHLGVARSTDEGIEMRVHPALIPKSQLLANVNGVMNAVLVQGDAVGPTLYCGAGAGAEPTASSVIADLVDVIRDIDSGASGRMPHLAFQSERSSPLPVLPVEEVVTAYYLRFEVLDKPGSLAEITTIFGHKGISIEALIQKEPESGSSHVPLILLTYKVKEKALNQALKEVEALASVAGSITKIRVETGN